MKQNNQLQKMVFIALLGAWAIILKLFDFPILPAAPFLKIDFSDMAVLIGLLTNGPMGAISVALIRDLSTYMMKGGEMGLPIGATMSFIASMAMFLPMHLLLPNATNYNKKRFYISISFILMIGLVASMTLFNYFIALPLYVRLMNFPIPNLMQYVLQIIIPFNMIKAIFLIAVQALVFHKIVPILVKHQFRHFKYFKQL